MKQEIIAILLKDPINFLMIFIKDESNKIKDIIHLHCKRTPVDKYMPDLLEKIKFNWDDILSSIDDLENLTTDQLNILIATAKDVYKSVSRPSWIWTTC